MEYPKIDTLFKRDKKNIIIPTDFTKLEFAFLKDCKWECTEKIDGMNTRIVLKKDDKGCIYSEYKGRTDRALIPAKLVTSLNSHFGSIDWKEYFDSDKFNEITIFGEGYGVKIQTGGGYLHDSNDFILFDVNIDGWWMDREWLCDFANKLGIKIVPLVGYMNFSEAIKYVKEGFKSAIAEDKELNAEGLVLKAGGGLRFRNGERVITKIKTRDFEALKKKYEQESLH